MDGAKKNGMPCDTPFLAANYKSGVRPSTTRLAGSPTLPDGHGADYTFDGSNTKPRISTISKQEIKFNDDVALDTASDGRLVINLFIEGEEPEVVEVDKNMLDPTSPEGYAKIMADPELQLQYQDVLDPFFQSRIDVVRKDLRDVDWESNESGELSKNGFLAKFNFKYADSEAKVIGYWVSIMDGADIQAEIGDTLTGTAADVAAQIDAVVTNSGTVTAKNYADQNTPQGPASNELDLSEDDMYAREDYLSVSEKLPTARIFARMMVTIRRWKRCTGIARRLSSTAAS